MTNHRAILLTKFGPDAVESYDERLAIMVESNIIEQMVQQYAYDCVCRQFGAVQRELFGEAA